MNPPPTSGDPPESPTIAHIEDQFHSLLLSHSSSLDLSSLVDLSSSSSEPQTPTQQAQQPQSPAQQSPLRPSLSLPTLRPLDLIPDPDLQTLHSLASLMISRGFSRDCLHIYAACRKSSLDRSLRLLGLEKLTIGDVHRLDWDSLESKIRRWIRAARVCVRVVLASELALADRVFGPENDPHAPFMDAVKPAALQLLAFPEAIGIGRRSPEKLFKILDLHDAISDLLPDFREIFRNGDAVYTQAAEILSRLAEAIRGILSEFENAVLRDPPKSPLPGGTVHPLTRYVMNYVSLISDYKLTLTELITSRPSVSSRYSSADEPAPEIELFSELEGQSALSSHLLWTIGVLQHNLRSKAALYKDAALSHLFMMNNVHYIVYKVKGSSELRELIADEHLKRLTAKYGQSATSYERATWFRILHCLRDEGLHVNSSFSSGVSKSKLRERFKAFNAAFDEVHKTQALWSVPDTQLRDELRISITEKVLPAYRSFLGRFRQHIESGRHPEMYIKYSVEDLEIALSDLFEGHPPSAHNRRSY